jgi:5'-nucleotidase
MRKVLLTNDDGVSATGLAVLATALGSRHDVYVVAPDRERSGVGHGFTLLNPLRADRAPDAVGPEFVRDVFRCSGTPVDCVKIGLLALWPDVKFDLVVSGINRGANLAVDTLYSGTVSAALEGLIMGYPALAVSLVSKGRTTATHQHFETAAHLVLDFIADHEDRIFANRDFILNINVPGIPADELKGVRYTVLGRCHYKDKYHEHRDPMGRPYYWLEGDLVIDDRRPEADVVAVRDDHVSVTPMGFDLTSVAGLRAMRSWEEPGPIRRIARRRGRLPSRRRATAPAALAARR